jgi:hypothetical protein
MSVKKLAQEILDDLKAVNSKESGGPMSRETLKSQSGQILVISITKFKNIIKAIFPDIEKGELNSIWIEWGKYLAGQGSSLSKDRRSELQDAMNSLKLTRGSRAFMVTSYSAIRKQKSGTGKLGLIIKDKYAKNRESKKLKEGLDLIGGQGSKDGAQLGHEEKNVGVSTSGVAAASAEARLRKLGFNENSTILKHIYQYYDDMQIKIDHKQIVDAKGGIKKSYIPVLFWQASKANQGKQQEMEREFAALLRTRMSDEIATMEGSTPLLEAVELVMFDAVAPNKKRKNVKVKGSRKKVVKDQSRGNAKGRAKVKKESSVRYDSGIDSKSIAAMTSKRTKKQRVSPFSYMAMINKKLPQTVRKNMSPPGFQNQSGRFANSVKIQDVNITKQGHPSFGYTYAKNPYQVFEVGEGAAPWATPQRDPRKLIDKSIRQVAAELAIGRFYTRRL